jgi:hypothetical protein
MRIIGRSEGLKRYSRGDSLLRNRDIVPQFIGGWRLILITLI